MAITVQKQGGHWGVYADGALIEGGFFQRCFAEQCAVEHRAAAEAAREEQRRAAIRARNRDEAERDSRTPASKDEYHDALRAMRMHGGSFASHIAQAAEVADRGNWARLYAAFPDLFERYAAMAAQDAKRG